MTIFEILQVLKQRNQMAVMATVVEAGGAVPRQAGARMLVFADGEIAGTIGGGAIEKRIIEEAIALLTSGGTRLLHYNLEEELAMACGGTVTVFLEVLQPSLKLIVFGAGHIGQALVPLAKMLGFHVTVVDNRPEFANKERLAQADQIIAKPYANAFNELQMDNHTYSVIVTHHHRYDQEILEYCSRKPFAYLGMIGSRHKVGAALARLADLGVSEKIIQKIQTPIGLDLGGQTPAEIAIAIAAEWIALSHGKYETGFMTIARQSQQP
jgi:xanthine dehydrogenase accessory factor